MINRKIFYKITLGFLALSVGGYFFVDLLIEPPGIRSPASYPENYESLKSCEKQNILWTEIKKTKYTVLPELRDFGFLQFAAMSRQEISLKGYRQSDFAPAGWKKYIHGRGAVAQVKFISKSNSYTGIFSGAECGLIRLSVTYKPSGSKAVAPGLALKIFRDKVSSANISALVSIDGQYKDFNIFKNSMSNIVPEGSGVGAKLVQRVFKKVSSYPEEILLEHMAQIDVRGLTSEQPKAPRQVFFVPDDKIHFSSDEHDFREDLLKIPTETKIYSVLALSADGKTKDYIGDIATTSEFLASEFGDDGLFFKHQFRK